MTCSTNVPCVWKSLYAIIYIYNFYFTCYMFPCHRGNFMLITKRAGFDNSDTHEFITSFIYMTVMYRQKSRNGSQKKTDTLWSLLLWQIPEYKLDPDQWQLALFHSWMYIGDREGDVRDRLDTVLPDRTNNIVPLYIFYCICSIVAMFTVIGRRAYMS